MKREYIGVDLHSTQITVHRIEVIEPSGSTEGTVIRHNGRYTMDLVENQFIKSLHSGCAVCLEACSGAYTLARLIESTGARAFVVNPLGMTQIFMTAKKTDKIDAKKLADCLKRHLENADADDAFPEVYVADEETQRLRMLVAQYQRVTADMTALRNNLYSIFRQWLVRTEKGTIIENLDDYLKHPRLPPEVAIIAGEEKKQYDELVRYKAELRVLIETLGVVRFREEISLLIGISGVSVFGAACIMGDIITIDRFKTSKNLVSYLSAAPRVDASNKTIHIGRLNKAGRKMSFEILLQSVNHLVNENPHLLAYTKRTVGKSKNKIRATAVARTIRQIFYILKNREQNRFISMDIFVVKQRRLGKILQSLKSA
jgi:transposase